MKRIMLAVLSLLTLTSCEFRESEEVQDVVGTPDIPVVHSPVVVPDVPSAPVVDPVIDPGDNVPDMGDPSPVAEPPAPTPEPVAECRVIGGSLQLAKERYAAQCDLPRRDCDPINGVWVCSSQQMGIGAPALAGSPTPAPAPTPPVIDIVIEEPEPTTPPPVVVGSAVVLKQQAEDATLTAGWRRTTDGIRYIGGDRFLLSQRKDISDITYTFSISEAGNYRFGMRSRSVGGPRPTEPPNDVWMKLHTNPWYKVFIPKSLGRDVWSTDVRGEHNKVLSIDFLDAELPVGNITLTISGRSEGNEIDYLTLTRLGTTPTVISEVGQFNIASDLLVLHYDHAPDPDDIHSTLAGKMVVDHFNIEPLVVMGAYGENQGSFATQADPYELTEFLYPDDYLDAHANYTAALDLAAAKWLSVLRAGGSVFVAEGGQSDFTADVVRQLRSELGSSYTSSKITVVQHSDWNERMTTDADLAYVRQYTNYQRIEDGNVPNSTADFRIENATEIQRQLAAGPYAQGWALARQAFGGGPLLDFSDTVELLHILGLTSTIQTQQQFIDTFNN